MATFPASFRNDSAAIHGEHQKLLAHLAALAAALEALGPDSLALDPMGAGRARLSIANLQELLPGHFRHEESVLFAPVSPVSPELAEFARQMRHEHQAFLARMAEFASALSQLEAGNGAGRSLLRVKEQGEILARDLAAHIALEEQQLDGFL